MNPAALNAALSGNLKNAGIASTADGIEAQELAGQKELVSSQTLPSAMPDDCRAFLLKMGFKFGEQVDDLFMLVEFPEGWSKTATSHAMHSDLLDPKGRVRASIFYKAAFYDRRADMNLARRFNYSRESLGSDDNGPYIPVILDAQGESKKLDEKFDIGWEALDAAEKALNEERPNWIDPQAYWDE